MIAIAQVNPLALSKLGSKVTIDLEKINDRLSKELRETLAISPYGEVIDYRITDGTDIGVILKLKNGEKVWFFNEEIKGTSSSKDISSVVIIKRDIREKDSLIIKKEFISVLNPINLMKWITYSMKDIV